MQFLILVILVDNTHRIIAPEMRTFIAAALLFLVYAEEGLVCPAFERGHNYAPKDRSDLSKYWHCPNEAGATSILMSCPDGKVYNIEFGDCRRIAAYHLTKRGAGSDEQDVGAEEGVVCPTFERGHNYAPKDRSDLSKYWHCPNEEGARSILMSCPDGKVYNIEFGDCRRHSANRLTKREAKIWK